VEEPLRGREIKLTKEETISGTLTQTVSAGTSLGDGEKKGRGRGKTQDRTYLQEPPKGKRGDPADEKDFPAGAKLKGGGGHQGQKKKRRGNTLEIGVSGQNLKKSYLSDGH